MTVKEKLLTLDFESLRREGAITIVAFGDSVTHGALFNEYNYETVYHARLVRKLHAVRDYVPINMINAAVAGETAGLALARMDKQVLAHNPDLIIVCFGLNDVNGTLQDYLTPLRTIFEKAKESGAEVIFMTPNMLNTSVDPENTPNQYLEYAAVTAKMQNEGRMDRYIEAAKALCAELSVPVCDCYAEWKKRAEKEDITPLLANRINHPIPEMHELFAQVLFNAILGEDFGENGMETENSMYRG